VSCDNKTTTLIDRQIVSETEAAQASASVVALRGLWSFKSGALHTLGEPVYQNTSRMDFYYCKVKELNPILWETFHWLYQRLRDAIQDEIGEDVYFADNLAVPGFHIFEFHATEYFGGGRPHFDLPYESIDWSDGAEISTERTPSFTLPLELPVSGGGINFRPELYPNVLAGKTNSLQGCTEYYKFSIGRLVMFEGQRRHWIGPIPEVQAGERRITCQGHCVRVNRRWIAYW
jgi:hypothetical protein